MDATFSLILTAAGLLLGFACAIALEFAPARWRRPELPAVPLLAAGLFALWTGWSVPSASVGQLFVAGGARSSALGVVLVLTAASVLTLPSVRRAGWSAAVVVSLSAAGVCLAIVSLDLLMILIALEITALGAYALVGATQTGRSTEAAMKYFVQGAVATTLYLLGLGIIVGVLGGATHLAALQALVGMGGVYAGAVTLAVLSLLVALAFKLGAAPFHAWSPDAYEQAPAAGAAFLAGPVKLGVIVALTTVLSAVGTVSFDPLGSTPLERTLFVVLAVVSATSLIVGTTVALQTRSFQRMLAYSGVAQVGYALVAVTADSAVAAVFFMATYALATCVAFLVAADHQLAHPDWDGSITGLAGMAGRAPSRAVALTIALASLAGFPPLIGFWGKFQVFVAALQRALIAADTGHPVALVAFGTLTFLGVAGSLVSVGYYANVVRVVFSPDKEGHHGSEASVSLPAVAGPRRGRIVAVSLALLIVIAGLAPVISGLAAGFKGFAQ